MKIAYDSQIFLRQTYGGISRYFTKLENRINELPDVEARIFAPIHRNNYLINSYETNNFRLRLSTYPNRYGIGTILDAMSGAIATHQIHKYKPDLVHETFFSPLPLNKLTSKRVITVYDMIREIESPNSFKSKMKLSAILGADAVICISESTRQDLLRLVEIDPDKVSTIYLGADLPVLDSTPSVDQRISNGFLLYVGQRSGYKNFHKLLRSLSNSESMRMNFRLKVFGGGPFTNEENDLIRNLKLTNKVEKNDGSDEILFKLYSEATALIYPSTMEGFGIPILEAMASGCPVICGNLSSLPEVAGNAAAYFDPTSENSISAAIDETLASATLLSTMTARGLAQSAKFSWGNTALQTRDFYLKTMSS